MIQSLRMWAILPSVVALLVIAGFAIYWATPENLASKTPVSSFDYWLRQYQTLAAGVLALVGGLWAYFAVQTRIRYDKEIEIESRLQRKKAIAVAAGGAIAGLTDNINGLRASFQTTPEAELLTPPEVDLFRHVAQNIKVLESNIDRTALGELGFPLGYVLPVLLGGISMTFHSLTAGYLFDHNTAGKITGMLGGILFRLTVARKVLLPIGTGEGLGDNPDQTDVKIRWSDLSVAADQYGTGQEDLDYMRILVDLDN